MRNFYILDIEELKKTVFQSARREDLLAGLIEKRREKVLLCRREQDRLRSLGAGLLLQYGLWQFLKDDGVFVSGTADGSISKNSGLSGSWQLLDADYFREEAFQSGGCFSREAILCLKQLSFCQGACGKPDIEKLPLHFNLSHSGRLAVCGISDQVLGVDIQEMRSGGHRRLWERFFTEEEKGLLRRCGSAEEEEMLFYRFWTAKEAYGKLTGRGLSNGEGRESALLVSPWLEEQELGIRCLEYQGQKGYLGMACYYQSKGAS